MLAFMKPKIATHKVPDDKVMATYNRYRVQALFSIFIGYLSYYIVRNNFTLSTPYLKEQLHLSATEIGMLSSCMLIAYGISKGIMSSLADKANPKFIWRWACCYVLWSTLASGSAAHFGCSPS